MGTEYYAINTQNKTFYDLGKGGWYALTDMEAFQDQEYLCNEILTECYHINDEQYWSNFDEAKKQELINYITTRVGLDLFEMMKNTPPDKIYIVNDCGDDITICRAKGYRCVGTRYYEKNSLKYQENLQFLNRHFDPSRKFQYDLSDYQNLPDFKKY